jgi:hypothetical protein
MTRAAFALLIATLSFLPAARAAEASIIGVWYEEVTYGGSRNISIMRLNKDGSFSATHRQCLKHGYRDDAESGRWEYQGDRLRLITNKVGTMATEAVNDYRTESNDGRVWVYRGIAGPGFMRYGPVSFRDVYVTKDSELPNCDVIS